MKQKLFNPISHGCSGKFGKHVVLRVRNGETLICAAPPPRPGKGTPAQEAARLRFSKANDYALMVMARPDLEPIYKAASTPAKSVHNLAVSDYFHAPEITALNISEYNGLPGDMIRIDAIDNFMVKSVSVSIYNQNNILVESGMAVQQAGARWEYAATTLQEYTGGYRVCVAAKDYPGNETKREEVVADVVCSPVFGIPCPSLNPAAGGATHKKPFKRIRISVLRKSEMDCMPIADCSQNNGNLLHQNIYIE
ncbi:hypothetical protein [uncultured Chitinophaga sp.]|uniref:hypothetical protein n=1 Tax=uncultured Chitinophaga sp. TaxID=339340 RepID=UPI0025F679DF|nr:hypothetical protein [uncultured Chitinophaga sp.]